MNEKVLLFLPRNRPAGRMDGWMDEDAHSASKNADYRRRRRHRILPPTSLVDVDCVVVVVVNPIECVRCANVELNAGFFLSLLHIYMEQA